MTKDARGGGEQAVPIPKMGDDQERRSRWAQYQFLRQPALQKSRSLAPNLRVQRSEAYRAILKLLLMARDRCRSYHTKTEAMDSIVEAVAKLGTDDRENFDADYDGYDGPARYGRTSGLRDCQERTWEKRIVPDSGGDLEEMRPHRPAR